MRLQPHLSRITGLQLFILSLGLWMFPPRNAYAQSKFEVEAIDGDFSAWLEGRSDWVKLRPRMVLPSGALVQTLAAGTLRLKVRKKSEDETIINIRADDAMTLRITEDLQRKLFLKNLYADKMEAPSTKPSDEPSFQSAWQKLAALYLPTQPSNATAKDRPKQTDAQAREKGKEAKPGPVIDLVNPKRGSILVTDRLPLAVPVLWFPAPKAGDKYRVFFGPDNGERLPFVEAASGRHVIVPAYAEGAYRIEIQAAGSSVPIASGSFYVLVSRAVVADTAAAP